MALRIEDNVDGTLENVNQAQAQLLKYLNTISSNRWLILKVRASMRAHARLHAQTSKTAMVGSWGVFGNLLTWSHWSAHLLLFQRGRRIFQPICSVSDHLCIGSLFTSCRYFACAAVQVFMVLMAFLVLFLVFIA